MDRLCKDLAFELEVSNAGGLYEWEVHLMCDSYLGCDQKETIHFNVIQDTTMVVDAPDETNLPASEQQQKETD